MEGRASGREVGFGGVGELDEEGWRACAGAGATEDDMGGGRVIEDEGERGGDMLGDLDADADADPPLDLCP